jgi:hypothetical protein
MRILWDIIVGLLAGVLNTIVCLAMLLTLFSALFFGFYGLLTVMGGIQGHPRIEHCIERHP